MDTRMVDLPAVRLVGHARRVPLVHQGVNPAIAEHVASIPMEETIRLKAFNDTEPSGVLAVSDDLDPDRAEGAELTYLHGAATTSRPEGLDMIEVSAGTWAVLRAEGPYPAALREAWSATATEWPPSQPWRLRPARDRGDARVRCGSRYRRLRALAARRTRLAPAQPEWLEEATKGGTSARSPREPQRARAACHLARLAGQPRVPSRPSPVGLSRRLRSSSAGSPSTFGLVLGLTLPPCQTLNWTPQPPTQTKPLSLPRNSSPARMTRSRRSPWCPSRSASSRSLDRWSSRPQDDAVDDASVRRTAPRCRYRSPLEELIRHYAQPSAALMPMCRRTRRGHADAGCSIWCDRVGFACRRS